MIGPALPASPGQSSRRRRGDEPTDTLPECTCAALRQAARHLTRLYDAPLAPAGIGLNQYAILSRLNLFGPMRVRDLAKRLVMDGSTFGHLLLPLQARGFRALRVGVPDRRSRLIALTPGGAELVRQARALWAGAESRFAGAFGPARAAELRGVLKRVENVDFEGGAA